MTLTPEGPGLGLFLVSIVLLSIAWVTVIIRVIVRTSIKGFGTDDWLMCIGLIFYTLACQAAITAALNGVGTHYQRLNEYYDMQGRKWFMFFQLFYVLSTVPIKGAICVVLLRITTRRVFKYILYTVMALATIACITTDMTVLTWCRPVAATWNKAAGKCANSDVITSVSYFISTVSIITDWTCAILPAFILWDVQLNFRVKASVAAVLALGVIASTATLVRLKYLLSYNNPEDYLYGISNIALWSIIESGVGIIAGSLATFRPLLRHIRWFSDSSHGSSSNRKRGGENEYGLRNLTTTNGNDYTATNNYTSKITAARRNGDSDSESQKDMITTGIIINTEVELHRDDESALSHKKHLDVYEEEL